VRDGDEGITAATNDRGHVSGGDVMKDETVARKFPELPCKRASSPTRFLTPFPFAFGNRDFPC
jgi:hypothetical protein